jgi:hypothetical protein
MKYLLSSALQTATLFQRKVTNHTMPRRGKGLWCPGKMYQSRILLQEPIMANH